MIEAANLGRISIGQGSTFSFMLPIIAEQSAEQT
jgi:hypothetical protein